MDHRSNCEGIMEANRVKFQIIETYSVDVTIYDLEECVDMTENCVSRSMVGNDYLVCLIFLFYSQEY